MYIGKRQDSLLHLLPFATVLCRPSYLPICPSISTGVKMRAFLAYEAPITDRHVGKMKVLAKVNAAWAEAAIEDLYFCAI